MACILFYPHQADHHPKFFKEQLLLLCTSLLSREKGKGAFNQSASREEILQGGGTSCVKA